jgi:deferrochelatase/peroxidase EfeB
MAEVVLDNATKADIQGFITSGYKHTHHTAYLFLQINDVSKVKIWLKTISDLVLTAQSWRPMNEPEPSRGNPEKVGLPPKQYPDRIINIAFTMEGLKALGLAKEILNTFPAEFQRGMNDPSNSALRGDTGENAPEHWDIGGIGKPDFHILLILNAGDNPDDDSAIKQFVTEQRQAISDGGLQILYEEYGYRRHDDKELFGFRDGISQPKIEGIHRFDRNGAPIPNTVKAGEFIMGYPNEYGFIYSGPVVPAALDPNNILPYLENPFNVYHPYKVGELKNLGQNGTFVVYRKLYQDIKAFWKFMLDQIEYIDGEITAQRVIWLASKLVGRKPNGDPLGPGERKSQDDFLYGSDRDGMHCPVGAHVRRTNPRDVLLPENADVSRKITAKHRIMRRGRLFGDPLFDLALLDKIEGDHLLDELNNLQATTKPQGLHFLCVNASIQRQFEFIQHSWANDPNFNELYQNKDPLIGDNTNPHQSGSYMTIPYDPVRIRTQQLPNFVKVLGGAYLFMPGLRALSFLAQSDL